MKDVHDEAAWQKAKADVLAGNHAVAEYIAHMLDDALGRSYTDLPIFGEMKAYKCIQEYLAHNSNHFNEIVSVRHMQGLWLEET